MSSRSSSHHQRRGQSVPHGNGRPHPPLRKRGPAGYTLAHGRRQLRLGPVAFWLLIGAFATMAIWTITTATYFAFREDVLTRLIARQAEMQFGYEDRIAELRGRVDRISSRHLLDQEQHEQKLDQIIRRQAILESRTNALSGLGDITASIRPPARVETRGVTLKASPINDKGALLAPSGREDSIEPHMNVVKSGGVSAAIARVEASLDRIEQRQAATLNSIEQNYVSQARRMRVVLNELGVQVGRTAIADQAGGMGGPFIPARAPMDASGFERQLHRIGVARIQIHRLTRTLSSVPVRKPINGESDLASGFGVRPDPFTGSAAIHTGLDIRGETGDAVRATAEGTVTLAGWGGGYGQVVDVDHGNGLCTRYGHLSSIEVRVGQSVRSGQTLGRLGSTGRSTGPHLHYETRVRGEAVDPQKFFRAGERLDASL